MLSCIACIIATVNGDENAVPTNSESSSSESNAKTPRRRSLSLRMISFERKQQDQESVCRNLWF